MGIVMEAVAENPLGPYVVGGVVLLAFLIALRFVFGLGKSRPHS